MWTLTHHKNWDALCAQFDWVRQMENVPQDARHHAEGNVAIHTQMVLDALTADPAYQALDAQTQEILWAAALLHDVEKRSTTVVEADGSITAHGHARKGAHTAWQLLYRAIPTPFAIREKVCALVRYHSLPLWLLEKPDPLKTLVMAGMEVSPHWLGILARADVTGRICEDQADLVYRVECFAAYAQEMQCLHTPRPFAGSHARMLYLQKEQADVNYVPYENPAFTVTLLSGLPGAGKDTHIQKNLQEQPIVSLDALRVQMRIAPTDKTGNGQVIQAARELARTFLRKKQSFVWNATNTTRAMREQLVALFYEYGAAVHIVYIEVPYAQLLRQNQQRPAAIPAAALDKLCARLEVPAPWEAHEVIYRHP